MSLCNSSRARCRKISPPRWGRLARRLRGAAAAAGDADGGPPPPPGTRAQAEPAPRAGPSAFQKRRGETERIPYDSDRIIARMRSRTGDGPLAGGAWLQRPRPPAGGLPPLQPRRRRAAAPADRFPPRQVAGRKSDIDPRRGSLVVGQCPPPRNMLPASRFDSCQLRSGEGPDPGPGCRWAAPDLPEPKPCCSPDLPRAFYAPVRAARGRSSLSHFPRCLPRRLCTGVQTTGVQTAEQAFSSVAGPGRDPPGPRCRAGSASTPQPPPRSSAPPRCAHTYLPSMGERKGP
jgi:hypothetical protein